MKAYQRTIEAMREDHRDKLIIDLRKKEDFDKGTYPGAIHLCKDDFEGKIEELPKDKPIYLLCYIGETSDEWAEDLQKQGYEIYSLEEGYRGYVRWQLFNQL